MTKAFISGITGMVGSHLTDYLLDKTNWEIHGMCRWRSPTNNINHLINRINQRDRIFLHYADLNDQVSLLNTIENVIPDYVFHLAAQSFPQTSFQMPADTLTTNIIGTTNLILACAKVVPKAVFHNCGSSEVFGRVPKDLTPIREETIFHPASPYAISKVGAELIGRFFAEAYGMTIVTTRMFTHTGPRRGDVFAESSFAKQIALIEKGTLDPIIKVGNLKSMRTWADVRDAVRAYHMLVTTNPIPGEYYNIGGSYSCEVAEMLDFLISCSPARNEIKIEIDPERLRPIDADLQIPDTTKFTNHTGWTPEIPFKKTMIDLLDYWRSQVLINPDQLVR